MGWYEKIDFSCIRNQNKEHMMLYCFDENKVVNFCDITVKSTREETYFYLDDIKEHLIKNKCKDFILAHNHPDNECYPSVEDIVLTLNVNRKFKKCGYRLLDHLIITDDSYFSFRDNDIIM